MDEHDALGAAIDAAQRVRLDTSPNPWVGAAVVRDGALIATGATEPPGGRHAEIVALDAAGHAARGATLACTLEPCSHHGRTPPCTDRIIEAGVSRVVVGVDDPDPQVAGSGIAALRAAGLEVVTGVRADQVARQLRPYLHHRRTGRPYVVAKIATTLDGASAAPDGSSQWITGEEARRDAHRLRAESDAILVGAGTVRADDPSLTVRHVDGPDPRRVVLGTVPPSARVHPCLEWDGPIDELLDRLGEEGVLQLMIEGGARTLGSFHDAGLVDRYVVYLAPALMANPGAHPAFAGAGAATIGEVWRGRIDSITPVGGDVRVDLVPNTDNDRSTR